MRNELDHIGTIERYLSGAMSNGERKAFENLMEGDPTLRADVELQAKLVQRIQLMGFKSDVAEMHNELAGSGNGSGWLRIALNSLLAIVGFCAAAVVTALILTSLEDKPLVIQKVEPVTAEVIDEPLQEEPLVVRDTEAEIVDNQSNTSYHDESDNNNETNNLVEDPPNPEQNLLSRFIAPFRTETLDANIGGTITTLDSKSNLHFTGGSFVTQTGEQVQGPIEIRYREYRNPAETAFSGIPMTYSQNNQDYNFNSAGMIEVRGYQNGQELKMKPGAHFTMDFNVTQQPDSCYFFALNDSTKTWAQKDRILFGGDQNVQQSDTGAKLIPAGGLRGKYDSFYRGEGIKGVNILLYDSMEDFRKQNGSRYQAMDTRSSFEINRILPGDYIVHIQSEGYDSLFIDHVTIYGGKVSELEIMLVSSEILREPGEDRKFFFRKKRRNKEQQPVTSTWVLMDSVANTDGEMVTVPDQQVEPVVSYFSYSGDTSVTGTTDIQAGIQAKNSQVPGLRCENFGVYTCSEAQVVQNPLEVKAKFVNPKGVTIKGISMISLIHPGTNASFSVTQPRFRMGRDSETVLLLVTADRLYAMPASAVRDKKITASGSYTFEMTDITDQVQSTEQLRIYLGL